jgi:inner membrane protein
MITDLVAASGFWFWIILGLSLIGLELLSPGLFLIWLGLAALVTGVMDGMLNLSWQSAGIVFAILSVACVLLGRRLNSDPQQKDASAPALNQRGQSLIGQSFILDQPIVRGEGQIKVGDSVWRITGPDTEEGATIRVTGLEGAVLKVDVVS